MNEQKLQAEAASAVARAKQYTRQGDERVDWQSTEMYWADPREQKPDAFGHRPVEKGIRVYFPQH